MFLSHKDSFLLLFVLFFPPFSNFVSELLSSQYVLILIEKPTLEFGFHDKSFVSAVKQVKKKLKTRFSSKLVNNFINIYCETKSKQIFSSQLGKFNNRSMFSKINNINYTMYTVQRQMPTEHYLFKVQTLNIHEHLDSCIF